MKLKLIGPNQNEMTLSSGVKILFSYSTPVAAYVPGEGYMKTSTHYSTTTSNHINKWLPENVVVSVVSQEKINELTK